MIKTVYFIPSYKNSNHDTRIAIKLEIGAIGYKQYEYWFRDFNFNELDLDELHLINGIPMDRTGHYSLTIFAEQNVVEMFHIKIK